MTARRCSTPDPPPLLNLALQGYGLFVHQDLLPRALQGPVHDVPHTAAAGHLHVQDRDRPDRMPREDLGEFRDISLDIAVQFRAEDDQDAAPQELLVEVGVSERDAVPGDEEVGIVEAGGSRVDKL